MLSNTYNDLLQHSLLSKEDTYELINCYQTSGSKVEQTSVIDKLIRHNFKYIYKVSLRFVKRHPGIELDDAIQVASLAVEKAVTKFNINLGYTFTTYLTSWLNSYLQRYWQTTHRTCRLPVHVQDLARRIKKYSRDYTLNNDGRTPSTKDIAKTLEITSTKVRDTLLAVRSTLSLHKLVGENQDTELLDLVQDTNITSPSDELEHTTVTEALHELLDTLSPPHRQVIELRFGLTGRSPMSLQKVGEILGCTREGIRQRECKALRQLRGDRRTRELLELYTAA